MARCMGLDYGSKRVGVSLSDESGRIAFPKAVMPNDRYLLASLKELAEGHGVTEIVIGESMDNAGNENAIAKKARMLGSELESDLGVTIHYEPEFWSSQEVRAHTGASGVRKPFASSLEGHERKRSRPSSASVDAEAAAVILNSFLTKRYGNND